MEKILLAINHSGNQKVLAHWLSRHYEVVIGDELANLEHNFSLCIVDASTLMKGEAIVHAHKLKQLPLFSPVLLITGRENISLAKRELWKLVDEVIVTPIETHELKARINSLLQTRALTIELLQAKVEAETANQAKSMFLASMSHELRTPMNSVLGMLELVEETIMTEEQQEYVRIAGHSARSLLNLLNDILDFSKIEAGRLNLESVLFNPRQVLAETHQALLMRAREKGLEIDLQIDMDMPERLKGDPTRLRQVLLNLLGNAVKFTSHGCITVRAWLLCIEDDVANLSFSVADTGIGIPREQQTAIFDAFTQADASTTRQFGGTGLGLAICSSLVKLMQGSIQVESTPGQGSRFSFTARFDCGSDMSENILAPSGDDTAASMGLRVLLAEDNPAGQKYAMIGLTKAGHAVTVAEDGEACVILARSGQFDLILMDVEMPKLDGFGATRKIRSEGLHTPIIALTAHAMAGFREKCLAAGMQDYLSKPFTRRELLSKMAQIRISSEKAAGPMVCVVPAPSAAEVTDPVLDIERAMVMMEGDMATLLMMMPIVRDQIPGDRAEIGEAVLERNPAKLKSASHRLKGSSGFIGAFRTQDACARLEAAAIKGEIDSFAELHRSLETEIDALIPAIADYMTKHTPSETA